MSFPIEPPIEPMLAQLSSEIPAGDGWLYEPKWDGFRAIVFRDGARVHIGSRNRLPLERYFPEVAEAVCEALPERFVADGEIVLATDEGLSFDMLQMRLHPAESRVRKLAKEIPAAFVAFDLLADDEDLRPRPFVGRRQRLTAALRAHPSVLITPQTADAEVARGWFERFEGAGLDGIVAKREELPYVPNKRVMVKVKHQRTADVVVYGYRKGKDKKSLGSLLLAVYDDGELHPVGFTAAFAAARRKEIEAMVTPLETGERFEGESSRWSAGRDSSWIKVRPELVCEVSYDHYQGWRFRHGAHFLRWRADKDAKDCTVEQFGQARAVSLDDIRNLA
jgi:ATP-dependent DNA ligase